jgi:hypothetical protein
MRVCPCGEGAEEIKCPFYEQGTFDCPCNPDDCIVYETYANSVDMMSLSKVIAKKLDININEFL